MQNTNHTFTPKPDEQVHLTDYLNVIKRRKWIVIIFFLTVVGIVTIKSYKTTPVYKATTKIMIERNAPSLVNEKIAPHQSWFDDFLQTQYNLLRSRSLTRNVIEDLQLRKYRLSKWKDKKPGYLTLALNGVRNYTAFVVDKIKSLFSSSGAKPQEVPSRPPKTKRKSNLLNKDPVVNWYLFNLEIVPIVGSRLVNISFKDESPEMTALIANRHALTFIKRNADLQRSTSQEALNWLKTQLQEQKARVEASERAIYEYTKSKNIISLEERQNIVSQKLLELNSTLTRAKSDRITKEATYDQLKAFTTKNEDLFSLPEIKRDAAIQNLRNQLVQLKSRRLELATTYGPKHPKMKEINSSIKKLEEEIGIELHRLRKVIKAELDRAITLEKSIQRALNAQKQAALSLNEKAIDYDMLQREAQTNRNIYDILLKQAKEISLTNDMETSNIRIVDEAEIPSSPFEPNILKNIFLAVILGLFMGMGLAFFTEYMDSNVKTTADITRLGIPVLGTMPYDKSLGRGKTDTFLLPDGSLDKQKKHPVANYHYYSNYFPTTISLIQKGVPSQVLMVESATAGEGKTTVLAKAAVNLAKAGLRVAMIDADFERPSLHNLFGFENDGGLQNTMKRMITKQIHYGNLTEYSMDDLFFLIDLKKQSGQLIATNNSQEMTAVFKNGHLLHIKSKDSPLASRLGTMLLHGGFIKESQLQEALERNQRTGQPLGYILINSGYLNRDKLQGPLKLQMEENLQKLFSWKQGTFVFSTDNTETYQDERIYFDEDYNPIIRRLGRLTGNRLLENEIFSYFRSTQESNLSFLPAGRASTTIYGPIHFMLLGKFLDIIKRRFDVVLIDAPPVLASANAVALSSLADGVIFVVKSGHLSVKAINEATTSLKEANVNIVGTVLNQVKVKKGYDHYYK